MISPQDKRVLRQVVANTNASDTNSPKSLKSFSQGPNSQPQVTRKISNLQNQTFTNDIGQPIEIMEQYPLPSDINLQDQQKNQMQGNEEKKKVDFE